MINRSKQQVKLTVPVRDHVRSRFAQRPIHVNHEFHLLLVCICLVSCSHEGECTRKLVDRNSSRDDLVKTRLRITPRARVPRSTR